MARKNNLRSEASASIHFDSRTNTVMAEATHENIKEKVQAVREVVPGKSNNEVVLVLQYYDYNVERAIQAYLEDGAKEALREWNFTGPKPNKKRKNKKKGSGEKTADKPGTVPTPSSTIAKGDTTVNGTAGLPNGDIVHAVDQPEAEALLDPPSTAQPTSPTSSTAKSVSDSLSAEAVPAAQREEPSAAAPQPQRQPQSKGRGHGDSSYQHQRPAKERTLSETSTGVGMGDGHHRKPHQGLEKAIKDLHRQTTSLERLRLLLDHEIDRSVKSMKTVFEELRQGLNSREAQLIAEMDVLKKEASEMLEMRQAKASDLKRQVDRSDRLKDTEISELRAEIKHFVSERRHDEDLGRTTRFLYDSDYMLNEFKKFGEVVHVKSMYTPRRPSVSSVASSSVSHEGNHDEELSHSQEVTELQDRLKNTLKLQNSPSRGPASSKYSSVTQNGPRNEDFMYNKPNQQREQNPRQSAQSYGGRGGSPDSESLDVNSNKPLVSSSLPLAAPPGSNSYVRNSSSQGPLPSYSTNTGSPGRGGRGGRGGGRGRGRGDRGGGRGGRGGQTYGSERSWPQSSQGEGSYRPRSGASAISSRPSVNTSN